MNSDKSKIKEEIIQDVVSGDDNEQKEIIQDVVNSDDNEQKEILSKEIEEMEDYILSDLLTSINGAMGYIPKESFSEPAFQVLRKNISIYIEELIRESIRNSKREKLDNVSKSHVEKASNYLTASSRKNTNQLLSSIAGILLGLCVGNAYNFFMLPPTTPIPTIAIVSTIVIGLIGAFLLAWSFK